jgi:patatin-like phospholipase/acyl hydrolase
MVSKVYNILSLDGGMGGYLTLKLLEKIESERPGFLDSVDIFAGTSAGAINSSILATHPTPRKAFAGIRKQWTRMWGQTPDPVCLLLGLTGRYPITPNRPVIDSLEDLIGDVKLGEVKRKILIPALRLDNQSPVRTERRWGIRVFSNFIPEAPEAKDLLRDVVVRSASAPVVWPAHQGYADGGLFANNPALLAVSHAIDHLGAKQEQFRVLSIGTGQKYSYIESPGGHLGYGQWLLDPTQPMALVQAVMDCNSAAISYACSRMLEDNFFRLDPKLGESLLTRTLTPEVEAKYDAIVASAAIESVVGWLDYHQWTKQEGAPAAVGS